jgi:hypothetical protein
MSAQEDVFSLGTAYVEDLLTGKALANTPGEILLVHEVRKLREQNKLLRSIVDDYLEHLVEIDATGTVETIRKQLEGL